MQQSIRVGLIGCGDNTRKRHVPGLQAIPGVEIVAVCNRRPESTARAAREFAIPRTYAAWQEVVEDPDVEAIVVGTWPHLHCPITLAALEMGKHVLTEARMCLNAAEAHEMLAAAHRFPHLVTQIVPSPYGMRGHDVMKELVESGFLGQPREMHLYGMNANLSEHATPLSWRQDAALSGFNMLSLGILHETVSRWVAPVIRVMAQVHAFIPSRIDPASGVRRPVGTPDSVQALTVHADGMRGLYQFSGVTPFAPGMGVRLYGSEGALWYDMDADRIHGARLHKHGAPSALQEIAVPPERARGWRVEEEFINAIRHGAPITFTDFATGVRYVEFTEAVARSARLSEPIDLPLAEFLVDEAEEVLAEQ